MYYIRYKFLRLQFHLKEVQTKPLALGYLTYKKTPLNSTLLYNKYFAFFVEKPSLKDQKCVIFSLLNKLRG